MTIKELYEWAIAHKLEDIPLTVYYECIDNDAYSYSLEEITEYNLPHDSSHVCIFFSNWKGKDNENLGGF